MKTRTLEDIYETLASVDLSLCKHDLNLVRSLVRMANVMVAMAAYGMEDETDRLTYEIDVLVAKLRGIARNELPELPEAPAIATMRR